ncbi:response regulator [Roseococcus sp. SDR]|uniref:response regulator n=1 Tax=Roseococcus sp. SDR TaxID=2835532 RepID=UPI001BD06635|nr:response regulator [Roseococcus sp. SDR]MBS7790162.1 response regulator [Roseococcus sp. SDR]MBV1845476.1 response regulator [Roseococcus sp. SDR]
MSGECLVVDDSAVVRKVARRILERYGFSVREAADGQQALDAVRTAMPRAVLLDRNMPVMDGIGFLRALRAEYGPDEPVVVMCTTEAGTEKILEGLEAGAQEYVMKPFDEEILRDKLVQAGLLAE